MVKKKELKINQITVVVALGASALIVGTLLAYIPGRNFSVTVFPELEKGSIQIAQVPEAEPIRMPSGITGLPCEELKEPHRPIAVMLAGDNQVRPLSGIATADMVVEMPVVTHGINRFMGVFSCGGDTEIGSVRSARDDFIPLAAGLGAIYGHWGGSYIALNQLSRGIIDNINAISNPFNAFFRKRGIVAPDNGFTTVARMLDTAKALGYATDREGGFEFEHYRNEPELKRNADEIVIGYPGLFGIKWNYDEETRRYFRTRGGTPEIDATTGKQVSAATVIVMKTMVVQSFGEYNDVRVFGGGDVIVFEYGSAIEGRWNKKEKPISTPLTFLDKDENTILFARGKVWLEVVQNNTTVEFSPDVPPEITSL